MHMLSLSMVNRGLVGAAGLGVPVVRLGTTLSINGHRGWRSIGLSDYS
jgi:hypothetical protein